MKDITTADSARNRPAMVMTREMFGHLDRIAAALERGFPAPVLLDDAPARSIAFRWQGTRTLGGVPRLVPVAEPLLIDFDDLRNVDRQCEVIKRNSRQFVRGAPANNVLLTGARGTGKSSLIRACLAAFHAEGLRLIEVEKQHLDDLPDIVDQLRGRSERFIIFCDDLSFEEGDTSYKGLKTVLDGSVAGPSANVLVYATSNRRHLVSEKSADNLEHSRGDDGEIHPGDSVEEKISLSERFGLWLHFYSFSQDEYLEAVGQWMRKAGVDASVIAGARAEALQWAMTRGARSGRIASQFVRDYIGRAKTQLDEVSAY